MRIDATAFLGDYPFRGFPSTSIEDWKELAARYELDRAVVSSFHELFWENNFDASRRLADGLRDDEKFTHFAAVNPAYPRQLDELPQLLEETGASGIRLFPNYHGYRLWDESIADLFQLAAELNVAVQIFQQIQDARLHWQLSVPPVEVLDFEFLLASPPPANVLLSGLDFATINSLSAQMKGATQVWFDLSRVRGPVFAVERLVSDLGTERFLFGSLWPIQNIASSLLQIEYAQIEPAQSTLLLGENWQRFAHGSPVGTG